MVRSLHKQLVGIVESIRIDDDEPVKERPAGASSPTMNVERASLAVEKIEKIKKIVEKAKKT